MVDDSLDEAELRSADRDVQLEIMRTWFMERYEDPVHSLPYDGREGGYQWIFGPPFDAEEELNDAFSGVVPDDVIEKLARELDMESPEWVYIGGQSENEGQDSSEDDLEESSGIDAEQADAVDGRRLLEEEVSAHLDAIVRLVSADDRLAAPARADIIVRINDLRELILHLADDDAQLDPETAANWQATLRWLQSHAPSFVKDRIRALFSTHAFQLYAAVALTRYLS